MVDTSSSGNQVVETPLLFHYEYYENVDIRTQFVICKLGCLQLQVPLQWIFYVTQKQICQILCHKMYLIFILYVTSKTKVKSNMTAIIYKIFKQNVHTINKIHTWQEIVKSFITFVYFSDLHKNLHKMFCSIQWHYEMFVWVTERCYIWQQQRYIWQRFELSELMPIVYNL